MRSMQAKGTPRLARPIPSSERTVNLTDFIAPYGGVISWAERHDGLGAIRWLDLKVQLAPSEECPLTGDREIRTDFYVQAELLISRLEEEGFPCFQSPRIIIDSEGGFLTGTVEFYLILKK